MSNQMMGGALMASAAFPCIVYEVQAKEHMQNAGICHVLMPVSTACLPMIAVNLLRLGMPQNLSMYK